MLCTDYHRNDHCHWQRDIARDSCMANDYMSALCLAFRRTSLDWLKISIHLFYYDSRWLPDYCIALLYKESLPRTWYSVIVLLQLKLEIFVFFFFKRKKQLKF
jgi:hypothetical protein